MWLLGSSQQIGIFSRDDLEQRLETGPSRKIGGNKVTGPHRQLMRDL